MKTLYKSVFRFYREHREWAHGRGLGEPDWWLGVAPGRRRPMVDRLDWVTKWSVRGSEEIGGAQVGNNRDVRRVELCGAAS